jgi:hypothetical protein
VFSHNLFICIHGLEDALRGSCKENTWLRQHALYHATTQLPSLDSPQRILATRLSANGGVTNFTLLSFQANTWLRRHALYHATTQLPSLDSPQRILTTRLSANGGVTNFTLLSFQAECGCTALCKVAFMMPQVCW